MQEPPKQPSNKETYDTKFVSLSGSWRLEPGYLRVDGRGRRGTMRQMDTESTDSCSLTYSSCLGLTIESIRTPRESPNMSGMRSSSLPGPGQRILSPLQRWTML